MKKIFVYYDRVKIELILNFKDRNFINMNL